MGMDISSKLLYGMNYSELVEKLTDEQIEQLEGDLDYDEIEYASPYYDSPRERWFVGIELEDGFTYEHLFVFADKLEEAEKEFKNRFGVTGAVRACKHVC